MKGMRRGRKSRKSVSFNPDHQDIAKALANFKADGGEITKVGADKDNLTTFLDRKEERAIDEFFNGGSLADLRF